MLSAKIVRKLTWHKAIKMMMMVMLIIIIIIIIILIIITIMIIIIIIIVVIIIIIIIITINKWRKIYILKTKLIFLEFKLLLFHAIIIQQFYFLLSNSQLSGLNYINIKLQLF